MRREYVTHYDALDDLQEHGPFIDDVYDTFDEAQMEIEHHRWKYGDGQVAMRVVSDWKIVDGSEDEDAE